MKRRGRWSCETEVMNTPLCASIVATQARPFHNHASSLFLSSGQRRCVWRPSRKSEASCPSGSGGGSSSCSCGGASAVLRGCHQNWSRLILSGTRSDTGNAVVSLVVGYVSCHQWHMKADIPVLSVGPLPVGGAYRDLLCPYATAGNCFYEDSCTYLHGDRCEVCGLQVLHPHDPEQRRAHEKVCT